ncbi:MAG: ABC transporter substrate-binding protein, partial [Anaerolineae bacterium]
MKKLAFATVTMVALLGLLVSACAPAPPPEPTTPPAPEATPTPPPAPVEGTTYKIGFAPSVTGGGSFLGEPERNVAEIIQAELEEAGGITGPDGVLHPVEIIMGDTESNPDVAASLARRYIDEDEVVALVMGSLTPISMAISAVAMEAEV